MVIAFNRYSPRVVFALLGAAAISACGGSRTKAPQPPKPDFDSMGECSAIEAAGEVSEDPELRRADRDLDRDGRAEIVTTDSKLCSGPNCLWNLFTFDGECYRFIGTVAGAAIEKGNVGESGFTELRSWWRFSSGDRALLHVYRFGKGGYQLIETLLCRQASGDGIQCALEESSAR